MFDTLIIGAGPAGLTAAIYANRALMNLCVVEQGVVGGQTATTDIIDNYPGLPNLSGPDLGERMKAHAESLGVHVTLDAITELSQDSITKVFSAKGLSKTYEARSVILATGGNPRAAGFLNEERFKGHGVSYCATCDAMFYRDKVCYVIGGGNAACQEADFLTKFASKIYLCVRRDQLIATKGIAERVIASEKITILYNTRVVGLEGETLPEKIVLEDTNSGMRREENYEAGSFGVFVFIGNDANTELVKGMANLDEHGCLITNAYMETNVNGLYGAGDVRKKELLQIITACADGAQAATSAALYVGNAFDALGKEAKMEAKRKAHNE